MLRSPVFLKRNVVSKLVDYAANIFVFFFIGFFALAVVAGLIGVIRGRRGEASSPATSFPALILRTVMVLAFLVMVVLGIAVTIVGWFMH